MAGDFQQTHENLLSAAREQFLEFGFERASIREICKAAQVTNGAFYHHFEDKESLFGALVDPVIQDISRMYSESVDEHFDFAEIEGLGQIWELTEETIMQMIEYIYDHFDAFRLILVCSDGTKYASFIDDVVRLEIRDTQRLIEHLKPLGFPVRDLAENEWLLLLRSYYASLAEVVISEYPKDEALRYAHTIAAFFSAGWKAVLNV